MKVNLAGPGPSLAPRHLVPDGAKARRISSFALGSRAIWAKSPALRETEKDWDLPGERKLSWTFATVRSVSLAWAGIVNGRRRRRASRDRFRRDMLDSLDIGMMLRGYSRFGGCWAVIGERGDLRVEKG